MTLNGPASAREQREFARPAPIPAVLARFSLAARERTPLNQAMDNWRGVIYEVERHCQFDGDSIVRPVIPGIPCVRHTRFRLRFSVRAAARGGRGNRLVAHKPILPSWDRSVLDGTSRSGSLIDRHDDGRNSRVANRESKQPPCFIRCAFFF